MNYSKGQEIVAKYIMRGQGIHNITGWREWLENKYNQEMVQPLAKTIDTTIKRAVAKAIHKGRSHEN